MPSQSHTNTPDDGQPRQTATADRPTHPEQQTADERNWPCIQLGQTRPGAWLVEGSLIKPFIDVTGEAIDLRTAAFGRFLFGIEESHPQARRPCISNL
jgi:hypothetical protein